MAYPIKPICEHKDIRSDGTSIIYLQFCAADGKRKLNTGLSVPPNYWNNKQRIINEKLPSKYGHFNQLNNEIIRQQRLAEDLIQWGLEQKKEPIGLFIRNTFRPDLDLDALRKGIDFTQLNARRKNIKGVQYCHASCANAPIVPCRVIIFPVVTPTEAHTMIFPSQPANFSGNGKSWPNLYDQIDAYINDKKGEVSPKTLQVYKNVGDHLRQYELHCGRPITFLSFDFTFYAAFKKFLTYDYVHQHRKQLIIGMKRNSMSKTIKHLRLFVQDRVKRKIIPPIDMTDFCASEEETDAIYLSFNEIAQIYHCNLSAYPHLIGDQKLFVLACLSGLRFSDFSKIRSEDYRDGMLYKKTEKSNKWVVIPLRYEAKQLLEDFIRNGFPKTDNVTFNENIKSIGKIAGITTSITFSHQRGNETIEENRPKYGWITSHTGRRSFCTNEFLAGTPVKLIMSISGYSKEKDFYRYIRITPEDGAQRIKKLWEERSGMQALTSAIQKVS